MAYKLYSCAEFAFFRQGKLFHGVSLRWKCGVVEFMNLFHSNQFIVKAYSVCLPIIQHFTWRTITFIIFGHGVPLPSASGEHKS